LAKSVLYINVVCSKVKIALHFVVDVVAATVVDVVAVSDGELLL
jgi:hypothetical protein